MQTGSGIFMALLVLFALLVGAGYFFSENTHLSDQLTEKAKEINQVRTDYASLSTNYEQVLRERNSYQAEIEASTKVFTIVCQKLESLMKTTERHPLHVPQKEVEKALLNKEDFKACGFGHAEGWNGEVVYWVLKGLGGAIARCSFRDSAAYNWPALRQAVIPNSLTNAKKYFGRFSYYQ